MICDDSPTYGNGFGFQSNSVKNIDNGDSCNTSQWTLSNHIGTYVDAPLHFNLNGNPIDQFDADNFYDVNPLRRNLL